MMRLVKVGEDGALLAADATEWVAVLDTKTNLMWDVKFRRVQNQPAADDLCKTLSIAGFTDWRAPEADQLDTIVDRTRVKPAINTDFFPDTPSDWFWTRHSLRVVAFGLRVVRLLQQRRLLLERPGERGVRPCGPPRSGSWSFGLS